MTATDSRPRQHLHRPIPYALTDAAAAALAAWPANRVEHEPHAGRNPCNGRGCRCEARRTGEAQ
jgi:hypothetical protein